MFEITKFQEINEVSNSYIIPWNSKQDDYYLQLDS